MRLKNFSLSYGQRIFKALGDEGRIRLLHLVYLNKGMCIADLEQVLGFTQSKTSRHMTYLKNAGLLRRQQVNSWVYYYIIEEVEDIVEQIFAFLVKDQQLQADQATLRVLYSNRELALNQVRPADWLPD